MSKGNYKSKNRASLLYVKDILENYSTIEKPLSNAQIREILSKDYNIEIHRETVKEILDELAAYDADLYKCATSNQKGREGYSYGWYYNRSSSDYDVIKDAIKDLYDNPALPLDIAERKAEDLMSLIPQAYKANCVDEDAVIRKNKIDNETYQILQQIKQIIVDNKNNTEKEKCIRFGFKTYDIEDKKVVASQSRTISRSALPLAVVEWNYRYWLIYYTTDQIVENAISHFCIDMMSDIRIIEKAKQDNPTKIKLIKKVLSEDGLEKYVSEHIGSNNYYNGHFRRGEAVYDCTLKIRRNRRTGITYFYEIFKDNFKITKEKEDYAIVKVRCTRQAIESIILTNLENIEIIEPQQIQAHIVRIIEGRLSEMLINTNRELIRPLRGVGSEKMSTKVSDNEKWFYVDFIYSSFIRTQYHKFVGYLLANGFKEKSMKKRHESIPANRYLATDKYESYQDIVKMIQKFADKNKWFYHRIRSYSVYEYKEVPKILDRKKLERRFIRVYYYKDIDVTLTPLTSYSEELTRNYIRRKNKNDK